MGSIILRSAGLHLSSIKNHNRKYVGLHLSFSKRGSWTTRTRSFKKSNVQFSGIITSGGRRLIARARAGGKRRGRGKIGFWRYSSLRVSRVLRQYSRASYIDPVKAAALIFQGTKIQRIHSLFGNRVHPIWSVSFSSNSFSLFYSISLSPSSVFLSFCISFSRSVFLSHSIALYLSPYIYLTGHNLYDCSFGNHIFFVSQCAAPNLPFENEARVHLRHCRQV